MRLLIGIIGVIIAGWITVATIQRNGQENVINAPIVNVSAVPTQGTNISPSAVLATTSAATGPAHATFLAGDYNKTIATKDGLIRSYIVHVPTGYDPKNAYPLVVVLHGGFGSGANVETQTGISPLADAHKFIAVYPDGTANAKGTRTWNAGACCGQASEKNVNDVAFIKELVIALESTYNINTKKVFATGMSNGAMLTNRLACEASDVFTAVAPVSGTPQISVCDPVRSVPILIVHGTSDEIVPYNGGVGTSVVTKNNAFVSVPQIFADWSVRNKCTGGEIITPVPSLVPSDVTVDRVTYSECSAPTILYRVNKGGHSWPGGAQGRAQESGVPTKSFDASKAIWSFFATF